MGFDDVIIVKTMKQNCLYFGNEMKCKDEICYKEVIYCADFDNSIKILINWQI